MRNLFFQSLDCVVVPELLLCVLLLRVHDVLGVEGLDYQRTCLVQVRKIRGFKLVIVELLQVSAIDQLVHLGVEVGVLAIRLWRKYKASG